MKNFDRLSAARLQELGFYCKKAREAFGKLQRELAQLGAPISKMLASLDTGGMAYVYVDEMLPLSRAQLVVVWAHCAIREARQRGFAVPSGPSYQPPRFKLGGRVCGGSQQYRRRVW